MEICGKELPVRLIVRVGVFFAFETMLKLPLNEPDDVGPNLRVIVQVEFGVSEAPHVVLNLLKGEAGLPIDVKVRLLFPVFWTVTTSVVELKAACDPKSRGFGLALMRAPFAVILAVQVFVPPPPLSTCRVQTWLDDGEVLADPLAPLKVPVPRLPVQL